MFALMPSLLCRFSCAHIHIHLSRSLSGKDLESRFANVDLTYRHQALEGKDTAKVKGPIDTRNLLT